MVLPRTAKARSGVIKQRQGEAAECAVVGHSEKQQGRQRGEMTCLYIVSAVEP